MPSLLRHLTGALFCLLKQMRQIKLVGIFTFFNRRGLLNGITVSFVIPGVIAKSTLRTSPTCRAGTAISSECSPSKIVARHVTDWIASSISAWMHINYPYNCRRVGRFCVTPPITPHRGLFLSVSVTLIGCVTQTNFSSTCKIWSPVKICVRQRVRPVRPIICFTVC